MVDALFSLRPAHAGDLPRLNGYAAAEGMDALADAAGVTVAVNDEDVPVGFIRVQRGSNGAAHVNPVVSCPTWRGWGVGRALMEDALSREGELRFVARGPSVPFYRSLGCADLEWGAIAPEIAADCDGCPMLEECRPQPMGIARAAR